MRDHTWRRDLRAIVDSVSDGDDRDIRAALAPSLLRLLRADHLASFVWHGGETGYGDRVAINMDPANLQAYELHFQFHDPVTPRMARYETAMDVDSVIDRRELEGSEFYHDFLARDGLHHGINRFVYRGRRHVGDLRVWRSAGRPPFDDDDLAILDLVGFTLGAHVRTPRALSLPGSMAEILTAREREVATAVLEGLDDAQICARLHISYGTARTHLGHIFDKCGVHSKMGLVAAVRRHISEFADAPLPATAQDGPHDAEVSRPPIR